MATSIADDQAPNRCFVFADGRLPRLAVLGFYSAGSGDRSNAALVTSAATSVKSVP